MSRILKNFFFQNPEMIRFPLKMIRNDKLSAIIPNFYRNFKTITAEFIDGLLERDEEFLQHTMSPFLFSKIQQELK